MIHSEDSLYTTSSPNYKGCLPLNSYGVGLNNGLTAEMTTANAVTKYQLTRTYQTTLGDYLVYPSSFYTTIETCIDICQTFAFPYAAYGYK